MVRRVVTFHPDDPLDHAIDVMVRRGFSGAPVTNALGEVVGILSEFDCMKLVACSSFHHESSVVGIPVREAMSQPRATINPEADLFSVVHCFMTVKVRRLPVVQDGRLVGLVSRSDVLRAIRTSYGA